MTPSFLIAAEGWILHAILAVVLIAVVRSLSRVRASFAPWEGLVLLVPYAVWLGLSVAGDVYPKGQLNLIVEPCLLAGCIGSAAVVRMSLANRCRQERLGLVLLVVLVVAAVLIWRYVPDIATSWSSPRYR